MKKQFVLLMAVLVIGSLAIVLPYYLSIQNKKDVVIQDKLNQEQVQKNILNKFTSKPDIVEAPEQQKQIVIQGRNTIYFEGIEKLESYLTADQVEEIKHKVQLYVHLHISNDILDGVLKPETIKHVDNKISFELTIKNVNKFEVQVTEDKDNKIVDITILSSL